MALVCGRSAAEGGLLASPLIVSPSAAPVFFCRHEPQARTTFYPCRPAQRFGRTRDSAFLEATGGARSGRLGLHIGSYVLELTCKRRQSPVTRDESGSAAPGSQFNAANGGAGWQVQRTVRLDAPRAATVSPETGMARHPRVGRSSLSGTSAVRYAQSSARCPSSGRADPDETSR